jgi:hypothetical protein
MNERLQGSGVLRLGALLFGLVEENMTGWD